MIPLPFMKDKSLIVQLEKATADAKTIEVIRKRIENQAATVDLVAKNAADANKLTKEVAEKNEKIFRG